MHFLLKTSFSRWDLISSSLAEDVIFPPQSSSDVRWLDPYMAFSGVFFCFFWAKKIWLGPFSDGAKQVWEAADGEDLQILGLQRGSDDEVWKTWLSGVADQLLLVVTWFSMYYLLGGGNSNMFFNFHPYFGEMIQFDEHIFQRGWNHQLDIVYLLCMCLRCCVNMIIVDKIWLFLINSSYQKCGKDGRGFDVISQPGTIFGWGFNSIRSGHFAEAWQFYLIGGAFICFKYFHP